MGNNDEYLELIERHAVIDLPEEAVSITICIDVYHEGKIETVHKVYELNDIREMFNKADEGYFADDDVYMITEAGRKWNEQTDEDDIL